MGAVLAGMGLQGSGFGPDLDEHLGIQAVGLPDTDIEADLPGNHEEGLLDTVVADLDYALEADLPDNLEADLLGNLEEGLLDTVAADLDYALEADLPGNLEADLPGTLEADLPGTLEEGLLDTVAADPDNALEAGYHHGIEDRIGTVDQNIQTSVVAESSHGPLGLVDEPLALRQNPSVPVHSDRRGDDDGVA